MRTKLIRGAVVLTVMCMLVTSFSGCGIENSVKTLIAKETADWEDVLFNEGLLAVMDGELFGYMNTKGEFVIEPTFEGAANFSDNGLARVRQDGKYGFINKKGDIVIECQYESASSFMKRSYTLVKKDGKWGTIDEKGNYIIEPTFDDLSTFRITVWPRQ